jgi:ribA/ribD-fused uncharacterized protein
MSQQQIDAIKQHNDKNIKGFFNEYRWLSNFHLCPVVYDGVKYPSSENAFQAAKHKIDLRPQFVNVSPKDSKKLGFAIKMTPEQVKAWDDKKVEVMRTILKDKFTRDQDLKGALLATGDKYLEETNWWGDRFWGVHVNADGEVRGLNILGQLLMDIRDELVDEVRA